MTYVRFGDRNGPLAPQDVRFFASSDIMWIFCVEMVPYLEELEVAREFLFNRMM